MVLKLVPSPQGASSRGGINWHYCVPVASQCLSDNFMFTSVQIMLGVAYFTLYSSFIFFTLYSVFSMVVRVIKGKYS